MPATEALVFDAIRTPRGRGKVNGSLHTTKPVDLVVGLMHEMLSRNAELDPERVDDLVFASGGESLSRVPMGSDGVPMATAPETNYDTYFVPQGISADLIATIESF